MTWLLIWNFPKAKELIMLDIYGRKDENGTKIRELFKNLLKKSIRYWFHSLFWQKLKFILWKGWKGDLAQLKAYFYDEYNILSQSFFRSQQIGRYWGDFPLWMWPAYNKRPNNMDSRCFPASQTTKPWSPWSTDCEEFPRTFWLPSRQSKRANKVKEALNMMETHTSKQIDNRNLGDNKGYVERKASS